MAVPAFIRKFPGIKSLNVIKNFQKKGTLGFPSTKFSSTPKNDIPTTSKPFQAGASGPRGQRSPDRKKFPE
jgi:hypothetical protein